MPVDPLGRVEARNWMMWGSTGFSSQVKLFGFYFKYCPHKQPYCLARYAQEVRRLLSVLEKHLGHGRQWTAGGEKIEYILEPYNEGYF